MIIKIKETRINSDRDRDKGREQSNRNYSTSKAMQAETAMFIKGILMQAETIDFHYHQIIY